MGRSVETGAELDVVFTSPLAPGRKQDLEEVRRRNQAAGPKGRLSGGWRRRPKTSSRALKRYEALVKVTGDKAATPGIAP